MMRLEMIELKERAEEPACWQAETAQAVQAEDYPLVLLRCRRDLPLRHETDPHEIHARQPPHPTEEVDMFVVDVGAVPGARQRHGNGAAMRKVRRKKGARPCYDEATASQVDWREGREIGRAHV